MTTLSPRSIALNSSGGQVSEMHDDELNETNFMMFAMKIYNNPQVLSMEEFHEDLNRIKYVKRLLRRYRKTGILRERLILNHIIILSNVFGVPGAVKMLFLKMDKDLYSELKTFLVFLEYIKEDERGIIDWDSIALDNKIITVLRSI
jgi:hypothetical protein